MADIQRVVLDNGTLIETRVDVATPEVVAAVDHTGRPLPVVPASAAPDVKNLPDPWASLDEAEKARI